MRNITTLLAGASALILSTAALADNHGVNALQTKALQDDVAYDIIEGMTTEVGPRQAGTQQEARARVWSVDKLKSLGFENVRDEAFMMPTWVRGEETAAVVAPYPQKLMVTALGNSASTGAKGITAEIAYFDSLEAMKAVPDGSLTGKIAFVTHKMHRTQDGSSYSAFGPIRWVGPSIASQKGASAYVIKSIGTDNYRNPDADNLERMIKLAQKSGKPVTMNLVLTPKNIGQQQSGNVIAEVVGRDPSLPMILIACHLDSWDLATGAFDDAAGCGIITAAAKNIKDHGQPLRTIRLLWAGAEEVGIWGGKAYRDAHRDKKHAIAMESDFGADNIWRVEFTLPDEAKTVADEIAASLLNLGIGRSGGQAGGGADIGPIIADGNLAIIDLQQDGSRYFDLHHTPDDTLDKIDPEQVRQNVAAWTTVLSIIANSDADFTMPVKK